MSADDARCGRTAFYPTMSRRGPDDRARDACREVLDKVHQIMMQLTDECRTEFESAIQANVGVGGAQAVGHLPNPWAGRHE